MESEADGLTRALRIVIRDLVRRADPHLTVQQLATVLVSALAPEPQTTRGLAARLGVSNATVSCSVNVLVSAGLLRRYADPSDRRRILISPTPDGLAHVAQLRANLVDATEVPGQAPASVVHLRRA